MKKYLLLSVVFLLTMIMKIYAQTNTVPVVAPTPDTLSAVSRGKTLTVSISSNPVLGNVFDLHITGANITSVQINIHDIMGKSLITQKFILNDGTLDREINVAALSRGIYILKVFSNKKEVQVIKFAKAK